jgi:exodeoxyribonuclease VII small subunit
MEERAPHDSADGAPTDGASFEASAERLAEIVERLESGELSLEDSLKLFEEGVRVARSAQARLDQAERRVEELLSVDEGGQARTRPFEP